MWKKDYKQKKGIYYSVAVIALGCLITSMYTNSRTNQSNEYSVDLSKLDGTVDSPGGTVNENSLQTSDNAESLQKAGVAEDLEKVNGSDVVNPVPTGAEIAKAEMTKAETKFSNESLPDESLLSEEVLLEDTQETMANVDLSFSPEDGLGWPLNGDVILGYSMDKSIFFETLQQYRYNPAIYISANQGDTVSACAKGLVTEIGNDSQIGTYVKTDLGNGYEITYGQLTNLQVKKNDVVARGQTLGSVAESTIYYTKEGDHVYLQIEKDGIPVNPMNLLQ